MTDKPIVVLGGTGKTGRRVASQLQERGHLIRVASRSSAHRFDWYDRSTWAAVLDGAAAVYVVDSESPDAAEQLRDFGALAAERGVERLVYLSVRGGEQAGDQDLLSKEAIVKEAGPTWTILRPSWFAQNFGELFILADGVAAGELRLPTGDGREPFVDAEEIAAVAVAALTEDGHGGQTYELSGPRSLSFGEAVAEIAEATGREIRYVPLTEEEYAAELTAQGLPPEVVTLLNELFRRVRENRDDHLSDGVQRVLGREPADFATYVQRTRFF
ncbi:NAD(P)H-binding protein [Streptomyces sp. SAJ15]|uniref:NmrA family NAD(P)-binding protein n=1 Tax=Streptomyces sp. SAJ15 TaxID=2011095 RepID=UPI001186174D|nr:NAD(P)H-binding protein [Streptomyces sp. SAJ15]TVL89403.1 NAD(P)-dependent oxidoreductase [Streptomyces sp. SAJ15]